MTTYDTLVLRSAVISASGEFSFHRLTTALRGLMTAYGESVPGAVLYFLPTNAQEDWAESVSNWVTTQREFLDLHGIEVINILNPGVQVETAKAQFEIAMAEQRVIVVASGPEYPRYMPDGFTLEGYQLAHPNTNYLVSFLQPIAE